MRTTLLFFLITLGSAAPVAVADPGLLHLPEGATKEEVIARVGWPNGKGVRENREVWSYPGYWLIFENDRVRAVQPVKEKTPRKSSTSLRPSLAPQAPTTGQKAATTPPSAPAATPTAAASFGVASRSPLGAVPHFPVPAKAVPKAAEAGQTPHPLGGRAATSSNPLYRVLLLSFGVGAVVAAIRVARRLRKLPRKDPYLPRDVAGPPDVNLASRGVMPRGRPPTPAVPQPPANRTRPTELTLERLSELEWKRFEDFSALLFAAQGWRAQTTGLGADGGIDVKLFRNDGSGERRAYVQCKAWSGEVGVKLVRELFGVMAADGVKEGFFMNTAGYSREARAFAGDLGLRLYSGPEMVDEFNRLNPQDRHRILAQVYDGDYRTPTCPKCGRKMRLLPDGNAHGCPHFRVCRSIPISVRKRTQPVSS